MGLTKKKKVLLVTAVSEAFCGDVLFLASFSREHIFAI